MDNAEKIAAKAGNFQLSCFYIGEALCGIDIDQVQEINKQISFTEVPHAPEYVLGIMNLRGRIVTIIDLAKKLGLGLSNLTEESRIIIVSSKEEHIGLLVDKITDVIMADWKQVAPPPSNIKGVQGKYFQGVLNVKNKLVAILDVEEVLAVERG
ncbi:purine-binding chemotaxis protein CheW [Desulfohalobiaceae bacterium Ax17]|jgi:purine-binding chemotaxis protein CheW|uniref:chemotaxis protein CheW n=1 Tax=Desulfovulcanus ferrireducens TaxID=2831190 RepID=UPI00207BCD0A|nr:chemotaxis protein CheW [Desulfovulcanus ferrireducens]MBT8762498.1 purine-binding chemotaxis protein CheW [Desulfovulcanus ferrireducens]